MGQSTPLHQQPPDEAFMLPAAGLFADEVLGAGHVQLPDDFFTLQPEHQLGILSDWRRGMDAFWLRSLVQAFRGATFDDSLPLPQRIELFCARCAERGIEVPHDFAIALQRC